MATSYVAFAPLPSLRLAAKFERREPGTRSLASIPPGSATKFCSTPRSRANANACFAAALSFENGAAALFEVYQSST
jgi:hypothetical protein